MPIASLKFSKRLFLGGAAALGASTAFSRRAAAADPVSLAIVNTISDAPLFIATAKGYFKDEGLDVTLTRFASGAQMIAPLAAGQLDAGAGAFSASFFNANERKLLVRTVADKARNGPGYGFQAILIRRELMESGKFKGFSDLKGLKVAIPSVGSSGEQSILNEALKLGGLTYDDCEKVFLPISEQFAAFQNGGMDATVVSEPTVSLSVKARICKIFRRVDSFYPNQEAAVLYFGENLIHQKPEVGRRLMRAYLRGVRFYNDSLADGHISATNADEVVRIIAQYSVAKDLQLIRSATPSAVDPNGALNIEAIDKDLAFLKSRGLVKSPISVADTIDGSFLKHAVQDLGPYKKA